jgi:hypothetical protein
MSEQLSLKETERKVFTSNFQDGLTDIFLGFCVLVFAVGPFITPYLGDFLGTAVFVPFWALLFLLLWMIRKRVTQPRLGTVTFGPWRKARLFKFNRLMLLFCSIALILGAFSAINFEDLPGWTHTARFSLVVLIGFTVAAYFLDFKRLYAYGVMIAAAPLIGEFLYREFQFSHHGFPVTFGITAGVIILTGLYRLMAFLKNHPFDQIPEKFA